MNHLAERRQEEKERRRADILDAAEAVAAQHGWDAMTMDEVARKARLSRALLYVYFKDKTDLMFGIGERALAKLKEDFAAAVARHSRGMDQVEAIGRAYIAFSKSQPVYFAVLARCEMCSPELPDQNSDSNEHACVLGGDSLHQLMVTALMTGMRDGSIRADAGDPQLIGIVLWGFMHGVIQLASNKANLLAYRGVDLSLLMEQAILQASRSIAAEP